MRANTPIAENIAEVRARIRQAAQGCLRDPAGISLLAVSKTQPAAAIRTACAAGIVNFGENYLQEALEKQAQLRDLPLCWHFVGQLQSNKTRAAAESFDWVHSVDRLKTAHRLSAQRPRRLTPLAVCIQVNISADKTRHGVHLTALPALADSIAALPRLELRGLMAIPRADDAQPQQRFTYARLRQALLELQSRHPQMDTLSMGMSADLETAIGEGATILRLGTAIFGPRK
ncbi:MAG: YggS family pyridoxal phosphate-dependent enzyme [Halieaceae bacterium]|nr:YggS family pyridoxal phosphate-dependent enzyme [Halieaceae bacterium]